MAKAATIEDVPVDSFPQVSELRIKLAEALAEQKAAQDELSHLHRVLDPLPSSSSTASQPTPLEQLRAKQQLPFLEERLLLAQALVLEVRPQFERVRSVACRELDEARTNARLSILRRFSTALQKAAEIGDELRGFDLQTVQLGGSNNIHPFGQLLDEPPYRQGDATRVKLFVEALERS